MNIEKLKKEIANFALDRDWDKFHTPKNLCMALSVEVSELLEIFQWLTPQESIDVKEDEEEKSLVEEEVADIAIYILRLCDKLDIDLEGAINKKLIRNAEKYPIELARGNATKYNRR